MTSDRLLADKVAGYNPLTIRSASQGTKSSNDYWRASEASETLLVVVQWKTRYVYTYIYIYIFIYIYI